MGCLAAAEGTIAASARKLVSTINHISVLFWYSEQQINLTSLLNLWTGLLFWWYVWQKVETTVNCKQNGSVSGGHGWLAEVNGDTGGGWKSIKWVHIQLSLTNISMTQIGAAALFIWAWKHQFIAHKIFARTKRQVMSNPEGGQYGVPRGDWFEYVSCPHYAAECLLYIRWEHSILKQMGDL